MYSYTFGIIDKVTDPLTSMMRALDATTAKANSVTLGLGNIGVESKTLSKVALPTLDMATTTTQVRTSLSAMPDSAILTDIAAKANVSLVELTNQFELLKSKGVMATAKDMEQFVTKLQQAKAVTTEVASTVSTVNLDNATGQATTFKEKLGTISTAALDVKRAFDYMKVPIEALPEHLANFKSQITNVSTALRNGNWAVAVTGFTAGLSESMTMVNEFRTSWQFAQQGFASSKVFFTESWTMIKTGALESVASIRGIGTTFLTSTLPSVLTFVGQSVIGFIGYTASLVGATGATAGLNAMMLANPIGVMVVGIVAVGAAVYGLITYWDEVKSFLVSMAKTMWVLNPFSWLMHLTKHVFPEFYAGVEQWFGKAFAWIDATLIKPVKDFFGWLITAPEKVMAVSQQVTDGYKKMFGVGQNTNILGGQHNMTLVGIAASENDPLSKKTKDLGIKSRMNEVKGSDRQIKNINIVIHKLVEKIENNFQSGNQFDARKIQEAVVNSLMGAMNDFNYQ